MMRSFLILICSVVVTMDMGSFCCKYKVLNGKVRACIALLFEADFPIDRLTEANSKWNLDLT
jgi:hypothetical protein